ncbi:hypothetical protein MNBD_ALPHA06-2183 [hydrothermal vent metagenome]|uniref:HTH araC/xylS-type domain-containing protein n=1 Tax=hydrothermal vent metagenome TaxID=652676 RepID=A0A3B0RUA1_9ZZZZ
MGQGWASYLGPVGDAHAHAHHAVQVCIAKTHDIAVEIGRQSELTNRVIVIAPRVKHRLQPTNEPACIVYLEPVSILGLWVQQRFDGEDFYLSTQSLAIDDTIISYKQLQEKITALWPDIAFHSQLDPIDNRVRKTLSRINQPHARLPDLSQLANTVNLSASRLRHLFRGQVGTSLSRYLLWVKLQRSVASLSKQNSLSQAAYDGGFSDHAHMARTFRQLFGIMPSDISGHGQIQFANSQDE